jgi:DNA-binding XRE family transcriptional regulator
MSELTKKRTIEGFVEFSVRVPETLKVPEDRAAEVQAALENLVNVLKEAMPEDERLYSIDEVLPGGGAGDVLRGARFKEAMTQARLAAATGLHRRHISEMETGKRPIGKEMAKRLGKALNVSYKVFL